MSTNTDPSSGANYPDSVEGRPSTARPGTQNAPVEDMHATTREQQLEGIIVQTRADMAVHQRENVEQLVRHRLRDSGFAASDDDVAAVVARVLGHETADLQPGATVPVLEEDETIPPRPEEELADELRAEPDTTDHSGHPTT